MISSLSELLAKLSSLLLNILDYGIISSYNSLFCLNTYFNTRFWSIVKIFLFFCHNFLPKFCRSKNNLLLCMYPISLLKSRWM